MIWLQGDNEHERSNLQLYEYCRRCILVQTAVVFDSASDSAEDHNERFKRLSRRNGIYTIRQKVTVSR